MPLAGSLERPVSEHVEIERKYVLDAAPALPADTQCVEIEQGYLPSRQWEERVRRTVRGTDVQHRWTIKVGSGVKRLEFEEEIDAPLFDALWALTRGRRIRKRRHVVRTGELVWEIDEFLDRDLWLAEIELPDEAQAFDVPAWLEAASPREVTESGEYANRKLAR